MTRTWLKRLLLVGLGLLVALLLGELGLRSFYPHYRYAAEAHYNSDLWRIWSRPPDTRSSREHPDTGTLHTLYYNNLGLRQHRDFKISDLRGATNFGFFGDSFLENLALPAQFSLTEPLDFLLNQKLEAQVLNFGVDKYGTDQAYLAYRAFAWRQELDCVFYVFCSNDLRNIYENHLMTLDEKGRLVRSHPLPTPAWKRFVARFHLTYLVLDTYQRYRGQDSRNPFSEFLDPGYQEWRERHHSPPADAIQSELYSGRFEDERLQRVVAIFNEILSEWSSRVQANGGRFYVVVLPRENDHLASRVIDDRVRTIDLYEIFQREDPLFRERTFFKNKKNGHWNELGNLLAALHLYQVLEDELSLETRSRASLEGDLYTYCSAFGRWLPPDWKGPEASPELRRKILEHYLALEPSR